MTRKKLGPTAGDWNFACDSYGKVRHSKKACVYTVVRGENSDGDQIIKVAAQIPNWTDARLIANAKRMRAALEAFAEWGDLVKQNYPEMQRPFAQAKVLLDRIDGVEP